MFKTRYSQVQRESQCLTFLAIDDSVMELGGDPLRDGFDDRPGLGRPALTYCLETGMVRWRDSSTGEYPPLIALRSNSRLAQWEPMTPDKFELMAIELGIIGGGREHPTLAENLDEMVAFTVTPDGYVFAWDKRRVALVSDVRQLRGHQSPLADISATWDNRSKVRARVGNGVVPKEEMDFPEEATLAYCGIAGAEMADNSDNRDFGEFTLEAADFVADQFGVDVRAVDWQAAIKARLVDAAFADVAPFDPVSATQALRLAAANSARPELSSARVPRTAMTRRDPARRDRPGTAPGQ